MGDVVKGHFGRPHWPRVRTPRAEAQESGEPDVITPEKGPPPLEHDDDTRLYPPGAPPFTGEDVEDAGTPDAPAGEDRTRR